MTGTIKAYDDDDEGGSNSLHCSGDRMDNIFSGPCVAALSRLKREEIVWKSSWSGPSID